MARAAPAPAQGAGHAASDYGTYRTIKARLWPWLSKNWEGCRESRRCSRDTHSESYITPDTSVRRYNLSKCCFFARQGPTPTPSRSCYGQSGTTRHRRHWSRNKMSSNRSSSYAPAIVARFAPMVEGVPMLISAEVLEKIEVFPLRSTASHTYSLEQLLWPH